MCVEVAPGVMKEIGCEGVTTVRKLRPQQLLTGHGLGRSGGYADHRRVVANNERGGQGSGRSLGR